MNEELKKAYEMVFNDMIKEDGCGLFKGKYDATNGKDTYMHGISTVMDYIAYSISEEVGDSFSSMFVENMIKSEDKARRGIR